MVERGSLPVQVSAAFLPIMVIQQPRVDLVEKVTDMNQTIRASRLASPSPFIVGIGGTTRAASSCERMVRAVLAKTEALGARTRHFSGVDLASMPFYAPEQPQRTDLQQEFVNAVRLADGVIIGSPGYHGGVSGLVKNALDLLQDLSDDTRPYLDQRPVGLVVVSAGWQAGGVTLQALRGTVHALRGWPTPIGLIVNTADQQVFDAEGRLSADSIVEMVNAQALQIMAFALNEQISATA